MGQISKLTNSEIGSVHWFNTIMGNVLRTGEYMHEHGMHGIDEDTLREWGRQLYEQTQEMLESSELCRNHIWLSKEALIEKLEENIRKLKNN